MDGNPPKVNDERLLFSGKNVHDQVYKLLCVIILASLLSLSLASRVRENGGAAKMAAKALVETGARLRALRLTFPSEGGRRRPQVETGPGETAGVEAGPTVLPVIAQED